MTNEIPAQFGRMKGAEWFPHIYKKDIVIVGQGGIGSWLSLLLCKTGCNLYLYDHDVYEDHNMTGQVVRRQDINKRKSDVAVEIIRDFSPDCLAIPDGMYRDSSPVNPIMLSGLDKMTPRKLVFNKWYNYVLSLPEDQRKYCFLQDGRLNAEQLQIFNLSGNDQEAIDDYRNNQLFDDGEAPEQECTFKQTGHFAAMIAAKMVTFLTNWISNVYGDLAVRTVPRFDEYIGPINMTTCSPTILRTS